MRCLFWRNPEEEASTKKGKRASLTRREKVDETTQSITLHGIISRLLDRETTHLAADHYFLEGHTEI